jgi:hypothetical protein
MIKQEQVVQEQQKVLRQVLDLIMPKHYKVCSYSSPSF